MKSHVFVAFGVLVSTAFAQSGGDGLRASDWSGIRAAYEAGRRVVVEGEGGWTAWNPGQGWMARFDGLGFEVEPEEGEWRWGLALKSWGRAGAEVAVTAPVATCAEEQRVAYDWDAGLAEWWVNDTRGLKHGFTVSERPAGEGALTLLLAVRGDLVPVAADGGLGVSFRGKGGVAVVNYSGLVVFDADGCALPARLEVLEGNVRYTVHDDGARYPLTIDPLAQQAYLKSSNPDVWDIFGYSVAVSGDIVVVGAPSEDGNSTGVNGDSSNNGTGESGAAYVFVRRGSTWSQQAYLKASNTSPNDHFGYSVAVSGETVVVGALYEDSNATGVNGDQSNDSSKDSGAAYVFTRSGTTWSQQAYLKASNAGAGDWFGYSLACSGDIVVVGAPNQDGSVSDSGAAYVFTRSGTTWSQQAYLKASNAGKGDWFGSSVAVSGDTVVVGASQEASNATGVNGNQSDDSAPWSGAAYVFTRSGTTWSQQAYLKGTNTEVEDRFGQAVAISGDTLVVGAVHEDSNATGVNGDQSDNGKTSAGAAYVFTRSGTTWSQQAYLKASNTGEGDRFGGSVAVSGDTVVVGAGLEDSKATGLNGNQSNNVLESGAAYLFRRSGTSWSQETYMKASNTGLGDWFGWAVAVSGDTVVVGAFGEDSNATGVNGDQNDDSASVSGAAYVFDVCASNATATPYGAGKPGTHGVPVLSSTNPPALGTISDLTVSGGLPGASPLLFVGFAKASIPFDGGTLHVVPSVVVVLPPLDAGGGVEFRVPLTPWTCGLHVYSQAMFVDPGAAGFDRSAQTNGLDWRIGG